MSDLATHLPLISRAGLYGERTAILDTEGTFTYARLLDASARVASALLDGLDDLKEQRVPFLVTPGFAWVAVQWGIWRAGGIAVPLPLGSPATELEYCIDARRRQRW
jgi:malonyl-CoA/methylmalonyl-CoA synthetase